MLCSSVAEVQISVSMIAGEQLLLGEAACSLQVQFGKLRSICVAAEQGLRSLLQRVMIALEEVPTAAPSAAQTLRSPSSVQHGPSGKADGCCLTAL